MKIKLFSWFASVLMLLCVQSANAGIKITCVGGSDFGEGEGCQKLFDGKKGTKWGSWDGWNGDTPTAVFKTLVPIAPASYELVIADDTNKNKGRNWKSWKIYGGNFADDDAALDAEDWELLDEKTDQQLTTDQYAVVSLDLSNPDGKFYTYFKIEVKALAGSWDDYCQMAGFQFTSYTVDKSVPQEYVDFDLTGAEEDLVPFYKEKLAALQAASEGQDVEKFLTLYEETTFVKEEISTLRDGGFVALQSSESWDDYPASKLVDKDEDTKWGGDFSDGKAQYIVFRTPAQQPYFYKLVTGNNTEDHADRNWKTWKVYGGNFATQAEAVASAEGWVVLDERENVGEDLLPNRNCFSAALNFKKGVKEKYSYYKIEIAASGGDEQQMSEIYFCTQDEFEEIRKSSVDDLAEFAAGVADMVVETEMEASKTTFTEKYEQLKTTTDVDQLSLLYNELVSLKDALEYSAAFAGGGYRVLSGDPAWGDGENWTKLLDGDIETKWGGNMPDDGSAPFVIFKVYEKTKFNCYKLVTGNDSGSYYDRNWKNWKIYGCNIRGNNDKEAVRDYSGWTLIDQKSDIDKYQLPAADLAPAYFDISETPASYRYYKIEVEATGGGSFQMSEFKMFTEETWKDECKEYVDSLENLKTQVLGDMLLVDPVATQIANAIKAVEEAQVDELLTKFAEARKVIIGAPKSIFLAKYNLTEKDGVLQIATAADLFNFAKVINDGTTKTESTFIDAVLTADIDLSEVITEENPWIPIGNWAKLSDGSNACYKGHFDGQGYTIKGFNATSTQNYFGIFGVISTGALIENFDIYGTINTTIQNAGSVAGYARDENPTIRNIHSFVNINNTCVGGRQGGILGNSNIGTVVVENCWYSGTLDGNDPENNGNYGGIVGYVQNNATAIVTISNCLFDGKLINTAETPGNCTFGGVVGYNNGGKATIKNCLSIGTLQSAITGQFFGKINGNNSIFANNYYMGEFVNGKGSKGTVSGDTPVKVTEEQAASGELCFKLGDAFRQSIGTDAYPVLSEASAPVSYVGDAGYATFYDAANGYQLGGDVKAYVAVAKDNWLSLTEIENVPAGTPVVLKGTYYNRVAKDVPAIDIINDLKGAAADTEANGAMYVLAKVDDKVGFYLAKAGTTIAAGKAYFEAAANVKVYYFAEDDATGIANVNVNDNDNQTSVYNLAGQRINKLQKGINIVNGKKVLK